MVQAAYNALTDDDNLANSIKNSMKLILYENLKDPNNALFEATIDPLTEEIVTPAYDMTVFVKNPNIYKQRADINFNEENVPGCVTPEGYSAPGLSWGWGSTQGTDVIAEDCMFQTWGGSYRVEQTITDLPAGIYTVMIDATEWSDEFTPKEGDTDEQIAQKEINHEQNRAYVKTSATPVFVEGQEEPEQFAGDARLDNRGQYAGRYENFFTDIVVTDGVLTLGVKWNNIAQMMFDRVKVLLAAPATDFNYKDAYETGIEGTEAAPVKVRAIQLYDLNGRRVLKAQKGITIVKKQMSDGTIRTEKVVVK
jgi:hypothetical protein